MKTNFFDVVVAKEFESNQNGKLEKKTKWNRIGTAWPGKNGSSLLFELFLIPGQRYVINLKEPESDDKRPDDNSEANQL